MTDQLRMPDFGTGYYPMPGWAAVVVVAYLAAEPVWRFAWRRWIGPWWRARRRARAGSV